VTSPRPKNKTHTAALATVCFEGFLRIILAQCHGYQNSAGGGAQFLRARSWISEMKRPA
jgi:hypothetical protein